MNPVKLTVADEIDWSRVSQHCASHDSGDRMSHARYHFRLVLVLRVMEGQHLSLLWAGVSMALDRTAELIPQVRRVKKVVSF